MQTLTNSFHNTSTKTRLTDEEIGWLATSFDPSDQKRLKRIKRRLCPSSGCTCSGPVGERR